jgi:hypothetical protein
MSISGLDISNYNLDQPTGLSASIFQKELAVTNALALDKAYDGNAIASIAGATIEGLITNDEAILGNHTQGLFAQQSVGNGIEVLTDMILTGADAQNYRITQPNLSAAITPKDVKVGGEFTVLDKNYDGTVAATLSSNNLLLLDLVPDDQVGLTNIVAEFENAEVGEKKRVFLVNANLWGGNAGNYALSLENAPTTTASIFAAPQQFTLIVSIEGQGSVEVDGESYTSALSFNEGIEITIEAIPESGWQFAEWMGDISSTNNPASVVINSNKSIGAIFAPTTSTGFIAFTGPEAYPNPFGSSINIRNAKGINRLVISNLIGQKLLDIYIDDSGETHTIKTDYLPKGIYLFTFHSLKGEKIVRKMIKN